MHTQAKKSGTRSKQLAEPPVQGMWGGWPGTDVSPAGQTPVPHREPHPRHWAASGMSKTGHKFIPTAADRTVNEGWQSPWGHLARGESQLRGEAKSRNQK